MNGGAGVIAAAVSQWDYSYESAREAARRAGRPLFVDFTGHTCVNCKVNERNLFDKPAVVALFQQMQLAKLYTDADRARRQSTPLQQETAPFHRETLARLAGRGAGTPYYMVLDPESEAILSRVNGLTNLDAFTAMLQQGLDAFAARR